MTKKKLEKLRIKVAILYMITYLTILVSCTLCFGSCITHQNISFIFYGILILVLDLLCSATLESLLFLLEERIYGVKNLDENENNSNKKSETKSNGENLK